MTVTKFPPFSLVRLLKTVFAPEGDQRIGILIDLDHPAGIKNMSFLSQERYSIQRYAHDVFFLGLKNGGMAELGLHGGEMFAYQITGGSNLDLPDRAVDPMGRELSLEKEIYPTYDILLCISTYSATAPLTAFAKKYGFRGATMHGMNRIILDSGLSVDYDEVSRDAESLRLGLTRADWCEIDFGVGDKTYTLKLHLGGQEAQKSHGLCREKKPDVANLPAGEVYYVPVGAEGQFPLKYEEDGTLGLMTVRQGRIVKAELLNGDPATVAHHNDRLANDPVTGELGELGLGTQDLPVSGRDIQDEKVLGTFHVATGRSDHLGGPLTPDRFADARHATHDDILYAPHKTPEVSTNQVRMHIDGRTRVIIENYRPTHYLTELLDADRLDAVAS